LVKETFFDDDDVLMLPDDPTPLGVGGVTRLKCARAEAATAAAAPCAAVARDVGVSDRCCATAAAANDDDSAAA
jgi:hypothetical protein